MYFSHVLWTCLNWTQVWPAHYYCWSQVILRSFIWYVKSHSLWLARQFLQDNYFSSLDSTFELVSSCAHHFSLQISHLLISSSNLDYFILSQFTSRKQRPSWNINRSMRCWYNIPVSLCYSRWFYHHLSPFLPCQASLFHYDIKNPTLELHACKANTSHWWTDVSMRNKDMRHLPTSDAFFCYWNSPWPSLQFDWWDKYFHPIFYRTENNRYWFKQPLYLCENVPTQN